MPRRNYRKYMFDVEVLDDWFLLNYRIINKPIIVNKLVIGCYNNVDVIDMY